MNLVLNSPAQTDAHLGLSEEVGWVQDDLHVTRGQHSWVVDGFWPG